MSKHTPHPQPARSISLQGTSNFRDLGGYKGFEGRTVRWRALFRSDHLANLNAQDLAQLHALNISRSFDFRGVQESAAQSYDWPALQRFSLSIEPTVVPRLQVQQKSGVALSKADALDAMQTTYRDFVRTDSDRFAQLFEHLLANNQPLVFHCTAGKDRTGLAAALILHALGVCEADILQDYLLTNALYKRVHSASSTIDPEVMAIIWQVQEGFLLASLEVIEAEYGGVANYLRERLGLTPAAVHQLRSLYLASAAPSI